MRRRRYEVTEMYALIDISNQMLEDSAFDMEGEIHGEATEQFAVKEGAEIRGTVRAADELHSRPGSIALGGFCSYNNQCASPSTPASGRRRLPSAV